MTDEQFEKLLKEVRGVRALLTAVALLAALWFCFHQIKGAIYDPATSSMQSQVETNAQLRSIAQELKLIREAQERRAALPLPRPSDKKP